MNFSEITSPVLINSKEIDLSAKVWSTDIPKENGLYIRMYMLDNKLIIEIVRVSELGLLAPGVNLNSDRTKPTVYFATL